MYKDEIIEEVWRNRDAYAATHRNDLSQIIADLVRRQSESQACLADRRKPGIPSSTNIATGHFETPGER
jgi:hypothetical protein